MPEPLNVVIDISHHNGNVNLAKAKQDGILGVIHKATQGQTFRSHLSAQSAECEGCRPALGRLPFRDWKRRPQASPTFPCCRRQRARNSLSPLDFEPNPTGPSMDLEEARAFVTRINEETGRFPGFYSGHYIKQLLGTGTDPV